MYQYERVDLTNSVIFMAYIPMCLVRARTIKTVWAQSHFMKTGDPLPIKCASRGQQVVL